MFIKVEDVCKDDASDLRILNNDFVLALYFSIALFRSWREEVPFFSPKAAQAKYVGKREYFTK